MRRITTILAAVGAVTVVIVGVVAPWETEATPAQARITFYLDRGVMYSGYHTHWSAAACSWNLPEGTQVALPDGFVVTCLDRGRLGWSNWIDIWVPDWATGRWLQRVYGDHAVVEILRWGW